MGSFPRRGRSPCASMALWRSPASAMGPIGRSSWDSKARAHAAPPYPFTSGAQLLGLCREHGLEMYELILANERALASEAEVRAKLMHIWQVMQACVERGFRQSGLLPGVLKVRRRAPRL